MAIYSLGTLSKAIGTTLATAAVVVAGRLEQYDELTEGMPDRGTLQVYPDQNIGTSFDSDTHKRTLATKHTLKEYVILADFYVRPRSQIADGMDEFVQAVDDFEDILDVQDCPNFGRPEIRSFVWNWDRVIFDYAGEQYVGLRIFITIRVG
jgi:hypothetical protein